MTEDEFLGSLKDLTGKVAVVTGGSQGIGLETTIYLATLGATVYVCTLDVPANRLGMRDAEQRLARVQLPDGKVVGTIHFHELDLGSVCTARASATSLMRKLSDNNDDATSGRLDMLVANAALTFPTQDILSPDGVERTFAVNCLGHFVFITTLLDIIKSTATAHGEARITITSSEGYKMAHKLDYTALTTPIPGDGTSLMHLGRAFQRYLDSKLGVLYLALELDRRLWDVDGVRNVFVNACHPGRVPLTHSGESQQPLVSYRLARALKLVLALFLRDSVRDAAKTQVLLSARENKAHGDYWQPVMGWGLLNASYRRSEKMEIVTDIATDRGEWRRFWQFCEGVAAKAGKRVSEATFLD